MSVITVVAGPFLAGLVMSLALVPVSRLIAIRYGFVAHPRDDRWHHRPIALSGGVAIVVAVLAGAAVFGLIPSLLVLTGTGLLAFFVGIADDLLSIKPATKAIAAIGLASILIFFGFRLQWSSSLTLDIMLTMFWIVGITNAFNLLDNMDGLCAGVALIVGSFILAQLGSLAVPTPESQYLALLLGAVSGFLVYNFHPASVFMGDTGSLFIGLMLAALALRVQPEAHSQSGVLSIVLAPVLVLLIPILDTTLVTVSRLLSGRSASQGGRDHSSHRLVAIGLSERAAVAVLYYGAAAESGVVRTPRSAVRPCDGDFCGLSGARASLRGRRCVAAP
jgi:UDP-GlcNAc:undecaprenyl-phosphate/decaprenyl-phosphate GlcNAc-1-phosphate transferase